MRAHPETPRLRSTVPSLFTFNKGELVDVEVTDLAYGGAGVGRVEGFVILLRRALPGDFVRARITARKPNYAEAEVIERHARSPLTVSPRCRLFWACGGCQWMNLAYEHQLDVKERQVDEALQRVGGMSGYKLHRILRSPEIYRYRNKLEMAFSKGPDGLVLGFHPPDSEDKVIDVPACLIGSERMEKVARFVKRFLGERGYTAAGGEGPRALLRHLLLREGRRTGELLVNLITDPGPIPEEGELAALLVREDPFVVGVVRTIVAHAGANGGERERLLFGKPFVHETLGGIRYEVAMSAFFQVNTEQAEALYGRTLEMALRGRESVLDLYCGVGALTLFLASRARRVTGIENSPIAVRCALVNAEANKVENVRFLQAEARKVVKRFAALRKTYDVVTINPPRSGVHADIVAFVPELRPRRIVYVSCNPVTLARDVAGFAQRGYRLTEVQPVDMFPHSYHVETIARLERED